MTDQIQELLNDAISAIRKKDLNLGEICCTNIIRLNPTVAEAYNLLAHIYSQKKEYKRAISNTRKAILCAPNNLLFQINLGKFLFLDGKDKEAISIFEKTIHIQPNFYQAYFELGKHYKRIYEFEKAKSNFEKAITLNPDFVPALNNLANLLQKENKLEDALILYKKALTINNQYPEIYCNIGHIYAIIGDFVLAEQSFHSSISINPDYIEARIGLGNLYVKNNQFIEAESNFSKALSVNGNHIETLSSLGDIYKRNGDLEKAMRLFAKIISIQPENKIAHINIGIIYFMIADHEQAKRHFLKVLHIDPLNAESKFTLAKLYELEKEYIKSKELYEDLLKGKQLFNIQVLYEYFLLKLRIADWSDYDQLLETLIHKTKEYIADPSVQFSLTPLTLNYFPVPNELHIGIANKFATLLSDGIAQTKKSIQFTYPKNLHNKKIRIGYISPDFRLHAVGLLLKDLFLHHDKDQVEIYAYSIVSIEDEYNKAFRSSSDVFRDISRLSHLDAAKAINEDQIHVLIDLAGYTTHCRPEILAYKPAAIQMSYLGYPNTSGSNYIDYIIGDKWILPDYLKPFYTEEFIHLTHAYVSSPLTIADNCPAKAELGLPENSFIYCCFNSIYKISPKIFLVWMHILKSAPNSVLWLSKENELAVENLKQAAINSGVDAARLIFAERIAMDEYLASYKHANLFLDTFYYSAGSTAICSMYAGVPILTFAGETNSSRMGASIVDAADQQSYIVESEIKYIEKALYLYQQQHENETSKVNISIQKNELMLFNLKCFTKDLEVEISKLLRKNDILN